MMRKIKYALAFLWGTLFASSIWYLALFDTDSASSVEEAICVSAAAVVACSAVAIIVAIMCFFSDHWSDD